MGLGCKSGIQKPFPSLLIYLTEQFPGQGLSAQAQETWTTPGRLFPGKHQHNVCKLQPLICFLLFLPAHNPLERHSTAVHHIQVFSSFQLCGSLRCCSSYGKQLVASAQEHPSRNPKSWFSPYLFSHGTIAFEEILAHFCLPGHVDMAVGAVAVAADPLQEVGAHWHL